MKVRIKWIQNRTFVGEFCNGHSMVKDDYPVTGGRNIGFYPMKFFFSVWAVVPLLMLLICCRNRGEMRLVVL
jgi:hypothetical protein